MDAFMATSVPLPMAMLRSARARAGLSLIPSPAIPTFLPSACSALMCSCLLSGRTPEITLSIPTLAATFPALSALSPESIQTSRPRSLSSETASAEVSFTSSTNSISAVGTIPADSSLVMVPVLSRTMESIFPAIWRESASFIRMPFLAQFPIPAVRAVGVASPSEQGQAMTSTVTIARSPIVKPSEGARKVQHRKVIIDIPIITGTKTAATLSTVC